MSILFRNVRELEEEIWKAAKRHKVVKYGQATDPEHKGECKQKISDNKIDMK